jgi:hypothetical protein
MVMTARSGSQDQGEPFSGLASTFCGLRLEVLREERRRDYELIEDLRKDRDHWRQQATALLTDQRATAPQKAAEGRLARAWGYFEGESLKTPLRAS